MSSVETEQTVYKVVLNQEEQYSIWLADRENPLGWRDAGKAGTKEECLSYIDEVWVDMRPLSLRKWMEEAAARAEREPPAAAEPTAPAGPDLITRLSNGEHPVELSLRPANTVQALRERIEEGYVHLRFTGTSGGTELGVKLDASAVDLTRADFEHQTGTVHLEGGLTLNYVDVVCVANLDLQSLTGNGRLVPVSQPAQ